MQQIVITYPSAIPNELAQILSVLEDKDVLLHIRKPNASEGVYEALLKSIPEKFYPQIVIHDYYHLQDKYKVGGVHFSTKNRAKASVIESFGSKSTSTHSVKELEEIEGEFDYAFLSPIFPSISKQAYEGNLDMMQVKDYLQTKRRIKVIALGGIDTTKIKDIEEWDFDGYAQLGSIWNLEA